MVSCLTGETLTLGSNYGTSQTNLPFLVIVHGEYTFKASSSSSVDPAKEYYLLALME
jgi:hypothetical protein